MVINGRGYETGKGWRRRGRGQGIEDGREVEERRQVVEGGREIDGGGGGEEEKQGGWGGVGWGWGVVRGGAGVGETRKVFGQIQQTGWMHFSLSCPRQ